MGMQYLALTKEQRNQAVGNGFLKQINMASTVNAAQMQRIKKWSTFGENAHLALKLHMEADEKSVDSLAKELETVKKDQARQQSESLAQHEKQRKV